MGDKIAGSDFEQLQLARRAEGRMPEVESAVYTGVNEHFEPFFNAVSASTAILR